MPGHVTKVPGQDSAGMKIGSEALCPDAELPPSGHEVGIPYRKLPWLRPTCLRPDVAQAFMRWLLDKQSFLGVSALKN